MLEQNGSFDHDPQRRAAREGEPAPSGPLGDPPVTFTKAQRKAWLELILQAPENVLTISDRVMVELYCTLVARMRGGDPDPEREGKIKPPENLKAAEANLLLNLLGRMGLTPADRSRVHAPSTKKEAADDTFGRLAATGRGKPTARNQ
jgi:phage terminase small subunit